VRGEEGGGGGVGPCALSRLFSLLKAYLFFKLEIVPNGIALRGAPPFLGAKIKSKIDIFHLAPTKLTSVSTMASALYY